MARRFLGVLIVTLLTAACAAPVQYRFTHPNPASVNVERDKYECLREAAMVPQVGLPAGEPPRYPTSGGFAAGYQYGQSSSAYNAAIAQAQGQQDLQTQLLVSCMRNRGYRLERQRDDAVPVSTPTRPIRRVVLAVPPEPGQREDRWPLLQDYDDVRACENDRANRLLAVDAIRQKVGSGSPDAAQADVVWRRLVQGRCIDRQQPAQPLK